MERLFEDMLYVGQDDWMGLHSIGGMQTPGVEMEETEKELVLKAEIPGINVKDLEVEVGEDRVIISGEHKEKKPKTKTKTTSTWNSIMVSSNGLFHCQ